MVDGVIEPGLHEAAVPFGLWFDQAQLRYRYSSLRFHRVDGSRSDDGLERGIQARKEISISMKLLGDSMGPVVWDVIGNSSITIDKKNVRDAK